MTFGSFLQDYWHYLTIPLISGIVGYGTNWLAVKMMMSPLDYKGIGPIGWQGIIPANAQKMARLLVDHSIKRVLTQQELIARVEPGPLIAALDHRLGPFVERIVDEVMANTSNYGNPVRNLLWGASPIGVKQQVYREVKKQMPKVLHRSVEEMKANLDDMMDINEVIIEKLGNSKGMIGQIFQQAAQQEFKFIERSGFYFGLPLGIPVMFLWHFYPVWWLLPMFGFVVGYITNALALYLVQKPLVPKKIGPFVVQGLFIKRQAAVSRYLGQVFADDLLSAEVLVGEFLKKESSVEQLRALILREAERAIDTSQGAIKPLTVMAMGTTEYAKISQIISDRAFKELENPDKRSFAYLNEVLDIENTLADRVGSLPPDEFFELLHPVFAEDEWKLIAVGALLGLGAGIWQWLVMT